NLSVSVSTLWLAGHRFQFAEDGSSGILPAQYHGQSEQRKRRLIDLPGTLFEPVGLLGKMESTDLSRSPLQRMSNSPGSRKIPAADCLPKRIDPLLRVLQKNTDDLVNQGELAVGGKLE